MASKVKFRFGYVSLMMIGGFFSQDAFASCLQPDKQVPAQTISDFLANPSALLARPENAQGGGVLIVTIRDMVASNPATLPAVIALLKNANPGQQTAIGSGLGQAANLCNVPDPTFATDIGIQLSLSNSQLAQTNFAVVTGKATGGVGAGGGVSGGGVGNGTGPSTASSFGGGSSFQPFSSSGVQTIGTNYFTSSVTGASGVTDSSTTTITVSNSVSR
ncbi:hypothetical protein JQ621_33045 [Bradyrhizobium manausense]|uniref:hypothetical protein n=1 Tax=Bradyrhizobium manausense TaxID=989370 RepID=UPI001BAA3D2E|nr:hypothetical protein [Bradyrhizobium manausense]MBR1092298.1 hypothetical protein [Bradyrhizobium manausense]